MAFNSNLWDAFWLFQVEGNTAVALSVRISWSLVFHKVEPSRKEITYW